MYLLFWPWLISSLASPSLPPALPGLGARCLLAPSSPRRIYVSAPSATGCPTILDPAGLHRGDTGQRRRLRAIEQRILADSALFQVKEIAYDPWNATHIALRLQDEGATMVEFRQGFRSMAAPTRELEKLIVSMQAGAWRQSGHPLDGRQCRRGPGSAGNLKPAKDKSTERIDGIVAAIMAIGRALVAQDEPQPEYSMFFV